LLRLILRRRPVRTQMKPVFRGWDRQSGPRLRSGRCAGKISTHRMGENRHRRVSNISCRPHCGRAEQRRRHGRDHDPHGRSECAGYYGPGKPREPAARSGTTRSCAIRFTGMLTSPPTMIDRHHRDSAASGLRCRLTRLVAMRRDRGFEAFSLQRRVSGELVRN
jgi:hypothetical protein